jgi:hypothetical protein
MKPYNALYPFYITLILSKWKNPLVMLCLVDRIPIEVEWQTPLARFRAFIPWFVSGMLRT